MTASNNKNKLNKSVSNLVREYLGIDESKDKIVSICVHSPNEYVKAENKNDPLTNEKYDQDFVNGLKVILEQRWGLAHYIKEYIETNYDKIRVDIVVLSYLPNIIQASDIDEKILSGPNRYSILNSDVIINLTLYPLRDTQIIKEACNLYNARGADMHLVSFKSFLDGALLENPYELKNRCDRYKELLDNSNTIRIYTDEDEYLEIDIKGRKASSSQILIKKRGLYHNLPAGNVFIPPIENKTNGKLVLDGPLFYIGDVHKTPIELTIKNGRVESINSSDPDVQNLFQNLINSTENANVLAEYTLGLNSKAKKDLDPWEFLHAKGVSTVAFGRNIHIGGKNDSRLHLHAVIRAKKVYFDDQLVVDDGKLVELGG